MIDSNENKDFYFIKLHKYKKSNQATLKIPMNVFFRFLLSPN